MKNETEAIEIAGKELVELAKKENCECTSNTHDYGTNWTATVKNNTHKVTAWYWVSDDEMKLEQDMIDWDRAFEGYEIEEIKAQQYRYDVAYEKLYEWDKSAQAYIFVRSNPYGLSESALIKEYEESLLCSDTNF